MGLASKLAAAGGAAYAVNQAYDHHQQHQQQAPPVPGQYGTPPPQAPQAPDNSAFAGLLHTKLGSIVATNALHVFYPPPALAALVGRLQAVDFRSLGQRYNLPVELALDLAVLALYDVAIYCDDSASMKFAEKGERIDDLKAILERVTTVTTMFDADGISIRAMNSPAAVDGVKDASQAAAYAAKLTYNGGTPLGHSMESKVLKPLLLKPMKAKTLRKPLLVITITDGEPTGEREDKIRSVIKDAKKTSSKSAYGPGAVAFEFAQVGRDQAAQTFLAKLDNDKDVGKMVDCTSYFELEQEECKKKGINLTPDLWMLKLMVGAVDRSYDNTD